jgi:hypothetical protein
MRLIISDGVLKEIFDFSAEYGSGPPRIDEYKIIIPLVNLSIRFFQQEKYEKLISCYLDFNDDVGFFFERIRHAIVGEGGEGQSLKTIACHSMIERNDEYVRDVLRFCRDNIDILTVVPPPWFERAMLISDAALRARFPDLADIYIGKARELLDSWQART